MHKVIHMFTYTCICVDCCSDRISQDFFCKTIFAFFSKVHIQYTRYLIWGIQLDNNYKCIMLTILSVHIH